MVRAWIPEQHPATLVCCITQRKQPASSLTNETSAPTQTWPSRVSARKADCQTDVYEECSRGHKIGSLITAPKLKVPAHSDPMKRWNIRKADWKCFCLVTDEAVERLPPRDISNIERDYQDFCDSLLSAARQCITRGRRKNYVPCRTKSASFAQRMNKECLIRD